ncbi:TPA: hypothetical protein ACH3X2_013399 [Trebouxia sp. C0005]
MDAHARDNILSGCSQATSGLHADTPRVAASLQTVPDDLFAAITALLLTPPDKMYSQLGAARAIASLGQTSHHFRVAMQRVWPELLDKCNANSTDQYKAFLPEMKLDTNSGRQRELQNARQDMEGMSAGFKRRHKSQVAHPHKVYALQDVQAAACRLYTDAAGLKAAAEAHQRAKAQKQADAVQRRANAAQVAEHRRKRLLALLPEDPLKDPRGDFAGTLGSWVLEEAVAAYTGTAPSLQAALDIYKRNFFLAVEGWRFREMLQDLRMDVKYYKKWNPKRQKQGQPSQRLVEPKPHPIGLTESELRTAAERECIWELGVKLGRMDSARRPLQSQAEVVAELHANAFQKVLDMSSLPNSFRKQVTAMMSQSNEDRMKEHFAIRVISERCSRQSMADILRDEGYTLGLGLWNSLVGDGELYH